MLGDISRCVPLRTATAQSPVSMATRTKSVFLLSDLPPFSILYSVCDHRDLADFAPFFVTVTVLFVVTVMEWCVPCGTDSLFDSSTVPLILSLSNAPSSEIFSVVIDTVILTRSPLSGLE